MNREKRMPVIAGNWKMNSGSPAEASALLSGLLGACPKDPACEVVVCPPAPVLMLASETLQGSAIALGAQNCHCAPSGAYTGEMSAAMLTGVGCTHVIVGHSERRQYFGETNETAGKRLAAAVDGGLCGILCVGESLAEREAGQEIETCAAQLAGGLAEISAEMLEHVMIAYEPVWAIGTGRTATAEEANRVCGEIRRLLAERYGTEAAEQVRILYGGSMNEKNAAELLAQPEIDGGLIGGASLKPESFAAIVRACEAGEAKA